MPQLLVFVLFFAGVYFLLLRPQQQRVRRQRELITAIGVGDRVVTAGGLIGRVIAESGDRLWLEIADGITVEFLRLAISRRLDEDTDGEGGVVAADEVYEEDALVDEDETVSAAPEVTSASQAASGAEDAPSTADPGAVAGDAPGESTEGAAAPAPGPDPH
jgi:preprotein translocase subunit YajC